jgi:hypothetical protein
MDSVTRRRSSSSVWSGDGRGAALLWSLCGAEAGTLGYGDTEESAPT